MLVQALLRVCFRPEIAILGQRVLFPVVWQKNVPEIGVVLKTRIKLA